GGFVKTMPNLPEPDCQIGVTFFTFDQSGVFKDPGMTISGYVLRPKSTGEIAITSADPAVPPSITANFLADEEDRAHTLSVFKYIAGDAPPPRAAPFYGPGGNPGPGRAQGGGADRGALPQRRLGFSRVGDMPRGPGGGRRRRPRFAWAGGAGSSRRRYIGD